VHVSSIPRSFRYLQLQGGCCRGHYKNILIKTLIIWWTEHKSPNQRMRKAYREANHETHTGRGVNTRDLQPSVGYITRLKPSVGLYTRILPSVGLYTRIHTCRGVSTRDCWDMYHFRFLADRHVSTLILHVTYVTYHRIIV
jgi:hypothetical protein